MVLDPIPQILSVHFFGSRPQPPTSRLMPIHTVEGLIGRSINYRSLLQKSPIKETIFCVSIICLMPIHTVEGLIGRSINYRSLLQKSPIKATIFCVSIICLMPIDTVEGLDVLSNVLSTCHMCVTLVCGIC